MIIAKEHDSARQCNSTVGIWFCSMLWFHHGVVISVADTMALGSVQCCGTALVPRSARHSGYVIAVSP